jgi:DNA-binding GntR family transcriptional regulator
MHGSPENTRSLSSAPRLQGVLRRTAHETVLETLRKAILDGVLEAGTPLVLADLGETLGVSKTPIREAIRDLASEGLIDFDSYKSSVVHTPTLAEAREIYEMRLALEPLAVRKSVGAIPADDLDRAEKLQVAMEEVEELGEWVEMNRDFHRLLTNREAALRLNAVIVGLRNASAIQVAWSLKATPALMGRANRDHAEILRSYQRADVEAAVEFTEHHLRGTLEAIEDQAASIADDRA